MTSARRLKGSERFRAAVEALGLACEPRRLPESTRTAAAAAAAVGCDESEIVKSLVFRGRTSDAAVLGLVGGSHRLDTDRLEDLVGEPVGRAEAAFVRAATGYAIGGVPPFGFPAPLATFIDDALFRHSRVWAAAGDPFSVFPIAPEELARAAAAVRARLRV